MTAPGDLEISRQVRAILARNWIDLGRITIGTVRGAIYLKGALAQIQQPVGNLDTDTVESMIEQIKAIDGVAKVMVELENWRETAGHWEPASAS